jgi:hypothetical protein
MKAQELTPNFVYYDISGQWMCITLNVGFRMY